MAIQQMLLGVGAKLKTYIDDVYSTYLYKGTGSAQSINNGVNISGEGGMVWIKTRGEAYDHNLFDTARGVGRGLQSNADSGELTLDTNKISAFNNNGFTLGNEATVNANNKNVCSWTFRKAKKFFDVVSYTGNGTAGRTISHSLGCVPGFITVKCTSDSDEWECYHKSLGAGKAIHLQDTQAAFNSSSRWNDTAPTASVFTVGDNPGCNDNGKTYVAYLFAGGESTAATARSVEFDGSNDYLSIPDNDAWDISSSDATIECWVNFDSHNGHDGIIHNLHSSGLPGNGTSAWALEPVSGTLNFYWGTTAGGYGNVQGAKVPLGQWQHLAVTKSGSTITLYQDGVKTGSGSITGTMNPGVVPLDIGGNCVGEYCDCKISNVRITKGQVLYTNAFTPSKEPLTTTSQGATASNVKLLCCNNSSATGSSVTPDTITNNNGSTASTDSPFDDPAGFVFGEGEDESVIKTGSYIGNASATGPEIYLGWEPQYLLIKVTGTSGNWIMFDSMRGLAIGNEDKRFDANQNDAESLRDWIDITSTGFTITTDDGDVNSNSETHVFMAIRKTDGATGKTPTAGTDVFNISAGQGATPGFLSGFTADAKLAKNKDGAEDWYMSSRLTGGKYMVPNGTNAESTGGYEQWDMQTGQGNTWQSQYIGYLWKRHAGFDVVTHTGNGVTGRTVSHNLGRIPEMMWSKRRDSTEDWAVYHKGMNGGTNPEQYYMRLNTTMANNGPSNATWANTAPTSSVFSVGSSGQTNGNNGDYIVYLFASVDGISKVGYYTGTGFSGNTQTLGFQPRFLIQKRADGNGSWNVLDSVRGITDHRLELDGNGAEDDGTTCVSVSSTGFTPHNAFLNAADAKYIYYAHA